MKELEKKSEEDQLKVKRALEAAIEAAARASKQSAVEESGKRDQLEELNEKLRQEIKQLQNANDRVKRSNRQTRRRAEEIVQRQIRHHQDD